MHRALVLRGPAGVGKSTLRRKIKSLWEEQGKTCIDLELDHGWGTGEMRLRESPNPGAGCNATHVVRGRRKHKRLRARAERHAANGKTPRGD